MDKKIFKQIKQEIKRLDYGELKIKIHQGKIKLIETKTKKKIK